MPYITWQDNLSVGLKEIDLQHRHLISMINRMYDAMILNTGRSIQRDIIYELNDYVQYHFETEENLLRSCNYEGIELHIVEHQQFTAEVMELKGRIDRTSQVLSIEILTLLRDWLQNHILNSDMLYAEHFRHDELS